MFTTCLPLYVIEDFSRRARAANSAVSGLIWPNFELIRDFIVVHVTCKNKEDPIKNEVAYNVSPVITIWELYVAMTTRALIRPIRAFLPTH